MNNLEKTGEQYFGNENGLNKAAPIEEKIDPISRVTLRLQGRVDLMMAYLEHTVDKGNRLVLSEVEQSERFLSDISSYEEPSAL